MSTWRILLGDVRETLATLPAGSVQTCVTSPPYFGLRDYGHAGQLGLEPTPDAYVAELVAVFREVRRVLRDDGTLWLNLGDSYSGSANSGGANQNDGGPAVRVVGLRAKRGDGLKPKDLIGIPWMVAFALRDAGWYLRSDIIWSKLNPMPESVTDRPTKSHEYLFLLSKSARYYYDAAAIMEAVAHSQVGRVRDDVIGGASWRERQQHSSGGRYARQGPDRSKGDHRRLYEEAGGPDGSQLSGGMEDRQAGAGVPLLERGGNDSRNKRTVWTVATQPYSEAHFATYPEDLITPCILAGSRPGDLVLDPFTGSGTTGAVAIRHQRSFVGCELNPVYVALARQRIGSVAPMFAEEVA